MENVDTRIAKAREVLASDLFKEFFGDLPEISNGVFGDIVERGDYIFINIVWSAVEGQGNVGRWLNSLPTNKKIVVPAVVSAKFAGMLRRRGFIYSEASDSWSRNVS